ncbi:MAG: helix-turn-helix transcriptional regulator [Clostridia bacterium]|nr:helix-turn-helix transcriptional regulator [Clostridia bacterium]
MNTDFPRILTLLRKERGLSQKEAAGALGVSQALLSHYENGKRECGLDFLVEAAEFYRVSCDYLLGRTAERTGATLAIADLPPKGSDLLIESRELLLGKRLIVNSLNVVFDLLMQAGNAQLSERSVNMLMISVYRVLRILHNTSRANPKGMFSLPAHSYRALAMGYAAVIEANAIDIALNPRLDPEEKRPVPISPDKLTESFPLHAPSLLTLIDMVEDKLGNVLKNNGV